MKRVDRSIYFGSATESRIGLLNTYQAELDERLSQIHDYCHPLVSGTYSVDVYRFLKERELNAEPMDPQAVLDYMMYYFNNLPDWTHPGTMVNVIPAVNLVSAATAGVAELFNPNLAQDTYSGNLLLAELEVVKYMSDLLGWDWEQSAGIFTFGGTGTNFYATKLALLNADPVSAKKGTERGKYFSITSKNGHPCHYQLCDWLGIGSDTCIEVDCAENGEIDLQKAETVIFENLRAGKVFLGFNLTGGSTNEMFIDPVERIYELREKAVEAFGLTYKPMIHVDSVLGWVYLFFGEYDFDKNPCGFAVSTLATLRSLYQKAAQFKYADTLGIDFHKTGFCPYITSLFIAKDKKQYERLNPDKAQDLQTMRYGDYNPFYTSLEYSRGAKGPIAALSCLKSLGKHSFCELIGDLTEASSCFRELLAKDPRILVIDEKAEGFSTIFTLIPPHLTIRSIADMTVLPEQEICKIRRLNAAFGKKIIADCVRRTKHFLFTSSRSYTLPGTDLAIGALKAYPMSVFFDKEQATLLAGEIAESITELYNGGGQIQGDLFDVFQDMTRE